jgi:TP901 family phage tail tape measure protein
MASAIDFQLQIKFDEAERGFTTLLNKFDSLGLQAGSKTGASLSSSLQNTFKSSLASLKIDLSNQVNIDPNKLTNIRASINSALSNNKLSPLDASPLLSSLDTITNKARRVGLDSGQEIATGVNAGAKSIKLGDLIKGNILAGLAVDGIKSAASAVFSGIGNFVSGSLNLAGEFEKQISIIKSLDKDAVARIQSVRDVVLQAGNDTKFSALEAAKGYTELQKAGLNTDAAMKSLRPALDLAALGNLSVADSAQFASTVLNTFGKEGLTVEKGVNILSAVANKTATDVGELRTAFTSVSSVSATLGLSFEDTSLALGILADRGIVGSKAGTTLRSAFLRLVSGVKPVNEELETLGIVLGDGVNQLFDSEGKIKSAADVAGILKSSLENLNPQEQAASLRKLGGTYGFIADSALAAAGKGGFEELRKEIQGISAAAMTDEQLNNYVGKLELLSGTVETLQIKLGKPINEQFLKPIVEAIDVFAKSPVVTEFSTAFEKLLDTLSKDKGFQDLSKAFGDLAKAIAGGLLSGLTSFFKFLSDNPTVAQYLVIALTSLAVALTVLAVGFTTAAIAAGILSVASAAFALPFAGVVIVIGLLIAGIVGLYLAFQSNFLGIKETLNTFFASVGNIFNGIGKYFTEQLPKDFGSLVKFFEENVKKIEDFFKGIGSNISKGFEDAKKAVTDFGKGVGEGFTKNVDNAKKGVDDFASSVGKGIGDKFNDSKKAVDDFGTEVKNSADIVKQQASKLVGISFLSAFGTEDEKKRSGDAFNELFKKPIEELIATVTTKGKEIFKNLISDPLETARLGIVDFFTVQIPNAITGFSSTVTTTFEAVKVAVQLKFNEIINGIIDLLTVQAPAKFDEFKNTISTKFTEIKDAAVAKFTEIGQSIIDFATKTVPENFEKLKTFVSETFTSIGQSALTTVTVTIPGYFNQAVATIQNTFSGIGTYITDRFNDIVNFDYYKLGSDIADNLLNGIKSIGSSISNFFSRTFEGLKQSAKDAIGFPFFATGVRNFAGGLAVVGERGPELVNLPPGSDVYNNRESGQILNNIAQQQPKVNNNNQQTTTQTTTNQNVNNYFFSNVSDGYFANNYNMGLS